MNFKQNLCILVFTLTLVGCGVLTKDPDLQVANEKIVEQLRNQQSTGAIQPGALSKSNHAYIGRQVDSRKVCGEIPAQFEAPRGFVWRSVGPVTLSEVADRLTRDTGIPVRIATGSQSTVAATSPGPGGIDPRLAAVLSQANGGAGLPASGGATVTPPTSGRSYTPDYSGTLSGFLSEVTATFNYACTYDGSAIVFDTVATRVYQVKAGPSSRDLKATVAGNSSGSGSSGSSSGGTNQSTSVTANIDIWKDIEQQVEKMLPSGGRFAISRATSSVVVVAPVSTLRVVDSYFKNLDELLSKRVAIEVAAFFVDVSDSEDFGWSLRALYKNPATGLNVGLADLVPQLAVSNATLSTAILNAPAGDTSAHFETSRALFRAVAGAKRLSDIRTGASVTQNFMPASIQLTTDEDFIKQLSFNSTGLGSGSTTAEVKTVTYGFDLQLLPRIIGNDEVSLQLTFSQSDRGPVTERAIGEGFIQLTQFPRRAVTNDVPLGSGETLVLAGYEMDMQANDSDGLGRSTFWGLGGRQTSDRKRTRLVLVVTPHVLQDSKERQTR